METVLKTRVIKIGNSQGIRIPKLLLERFNLSNDIELLAQDGLLVIRPAFHPRSGAGDHDNSICTALSVYKKKKIYSYLTWTKDR